MSLTRLCKLHYNDSIEIAVEAIRLEDTTGGMRGCSKSRWSAYTSDVMCNITANTKELKKQIASGLFSITKMRNLQSSYGSHCYSCSSCSEARQGWDKQVEGALIAIPRFSTLRV